MGYKDDSIEGLASALMKCSEGAKRDIIEIIDALIVDIYEQ